MHMSRWMRGCLLAALSVLVSVLFAGAALADPELPPPDPGPVAPPADAPPPLALPPWLAPPPGPDVPPPPAGDPVPVAAPTGPVAGQNPTPFTGAPPFRPPTFNPVNGSMVGVAKPIIIDFAVPIADQAMAESAIHI